MTVLLQRILKSGWKNFKRQASFSLAASFVLTITSLLIGVLVLGGVMTSFLIEEAQSKADISIYIKDGDASRLKEEISSISGVKEVSLRSKEEALSDFREKHKDDEELMRSLDEVGVNPFLASINVKALDTDTYGRVEGFLEDSEWSEMVEGADYHRRQSVIDRIFDFTNFVKRGGLVLIGILALVSSFVTYSTIKLAIEGQEQEVRAMKLVGASDLFIGGPFVVQAFILGAISFVVSFGVLFLFSYFLTPRVSSLLSGFKIVGFFKESVWEIALFQFLSSVVLAMGSSVLALRKYLGV